MGQLIAAAPVSTGDGGNTLGGLSLSEEECQDSCLLATPGFPWLQPDPPEASLINFKKAFKDFRIIFCFL